MLKGTNVGRERMWCSQSVTKDWVLSRKIVVGEEAHQQRDLSLIYKPVLKITKEGGCASTLAVSSGQARGNHSQSEAYEQVASLLVASYVQHWTAHREEPGKDAVMSRAPAATS